MGDQSSLHCPTPHHPCTPPMFLPVNSWTHMGNVLHRTSFPKSYYSNMGKLHSSEQRPNHSHGKEKKKQSSPYLPINPLLISLHEIPSVTSQILFLVIIALREASDPGGYWWPLTYSNWLLLIVFSSKRSSVILCNCGFYTSGVV
jgi:hypothetical protein